MMTTTTTPLLTNAPHDAAITKNRTSSGKSHVRSKPPSSMRTWWKVYSKYSGNHQITKNIKYGLVLLCIA